MSLRRAIVLGLCLASCAPSAPTGDGGVIVPDATAARLELGTGAPSTWTAVREGQTVLLQRGCQGAQHVFFSLRVWGMDVLEAPTLRLSIVRERDGLVVSSSYTLRLLPNVVGAYAEWTGLSPVVEEPSTVIDERVWMRASVQSSDRSTTVQDSRLVRVMWGPDSCRPHG